MALPLRRTNALPVRRCCYGCSSLGSLCISETCGLRVRDLQLNGDAGQVTVFGKGGKTRVMLLKATMWTDLSWLRGPAPDAAVFRLREGGGALDPS